MTNDATVKFRLPSSVKERLVAEAKKQDVSLGHLMRGMVIHAPV
jgi:predicted HicB family RNase H-like nuclease